MMKTKIYFRSDGHSQMGMGHIVRSVALAKMLQPQFNCSFLIKNSGDNVVEYIQKSGFEFSRLPAGMNENTEATYLTKHYLTGKEIVVLDGYQFDLNYQKIIKGSGCKLVCIDDIQHSAFTADAVINHAGGLSSEDFSAEEGTALYLGYQYLLLREPFLSYTKNQPDIQKKGKEEVFVCLGGADPNNDLISVLKTCDDHPSIKKCNVVLGSAYPHHWRLYDFCQNSEMEVQLFFNLSAAEMVLLMGQHQTAICSPSTVALEFLCTEGDLFLHQIADNQSQILKSLTQGNLAFPLNQIKTVSDEQKKSAREKRKSLFDGNSDKRIKKIFCRLDNQLQGSLRPTSPNDLYLFFEWTNEKMTRQQSFNQQPIPIEDHINWFKRKMASSCCRMYTLEYKKQPVGQVRFELDGTTATINYSIDRHFRGRGMGGYLLEESIRLLQTEEPGIDTIEGFVKENNTASNRIFIQLGFSIANIKAVKGSFRYIQQLDTRLLSKEIRA